MHLMTFDPDCDLILCFSFGQQGEFSSGVFADIYKHSCTLCRKSAHTSKKISMKPPKEFFCLSFMRKLLWVSKYMRFIYYILRTYLAMVFWSWTRNCVILVTVGGVTAYFRNSLRIASAPMSTNRATRR